MNSTTDITLEIRFFREAVLSSITPLLRALKKEIERLSELPPKCYEEVEIKLFGKKHFKKPRFWDYVKAEKWDLFEDSLKILTALLEGGDLPQFTIGSNIDGVRRMAEVRAEELKAIIERVSDLITQTKNGYILTATINYANSKKSLNTLDKDAVLPSKKEVVQYLYHLKSINVILGDRFITALSEKINPSFKDSILINNLLEAEESLPSNAGQYRQIAREVLSIKSGMEDCEQVYGALNRSINICAAINKNYFITEYNAFAELPPSPYYSGDFLKTQLSQAKNTFTPEEYLAITGEITAGHSFPYKEPTKCEYFPGLKEKYWEVSIVKNLAAEVSSHECIDEEDESLFMYLFFGYGSIPKTQKKLYWKDQFDARKKDGTVRHPSELYYLLTTLYRDFNKTFTLEFICDRLEFSDKTLPLIKEIVPKGKMRQLAQRCNSEFKKSIDAALNCQE